VGVVTIFSDYICPYCYVVKGPLERAADELGLAVVWRHFPLYPELPDEGMPLEEHLGSYADVLWTSLNEITARWGGPSMHRTHQISNTRWAQEASEYAKVVGQFAAFHQAVFKAYYEDGMNIGTREAVLTIAEWVGLDWRELARHLAAGTFRPNVRADWAEARRLNIYTIPTMLVGTRRLVGALPYERLLVALAEAVDAEGRVCGSDECRV